MDAALSEVCRKPNILEEEQKRTNPTRFPSSSTVFSPLRSFNALTEQLVVKLVSIWFIIQDRNWPKAGCNQNRDYFFLFSFFCWNLHFSFFFFSFWNLLFASESYASMRYFSTSPIIIFTYAQRIRISPFSWFSALNLLFRYPILFFYIRTLRFYHFFVILL